MPQEGTPRPSPPGQHNNIQARSEVESDSEMRSRPRESKASYGDDETLSPEASDRVFPIRSVVSVDPTSTPSIQASLRQGSQQDGYFYNASRVQGKRRISTSTDGSYRSERQTRESSSSTLTPRAEESNRLQTSNDENARPSPARLPSQLFNDLVKGPGDNTASHSRTASLGASAAASVRSMPVSDDGKGIMTARFKHVVTEDGHAVITGRDGDVLQRCEDEPIAYPGAVQGFGLLLALQETDGKYVVRVVSENSESLIGFAPKQLFALDTFTDILSEEQADNFLDHIDFIKDEDADVATNGPEVFTISIRPPKMRTKKLWCAMHINERNSKLIICEFELEDDQANPLVPLNEMTPDLPEDTLDSNPTAEEYAGSTQNISRPLRVLRSARKRRGEAAAMEVFNIMSQVQEQLASATSLENFLKVLVGVVKELTGFHRVMIYQFDQQWNGRVVTELLDPRYTRDLYKGLNFPASDIPRQARELYKINRVRLLYDRDQETARLVCRTMEDLDNPLDLTHSYLRAMSPIHIKYLTNMAVRSSMSISINAFNELWGLISLHSYGQNGMRVAFPIRKMCRLVGDMASRNIERLSYASRLQARRLINTASTPQNPAGYIVASSEDLLKLFDADFGLLSIRDETKVLGKIVQSQEALAMLEYLRMRRITSVTTSHDITQDFPDLIYPPGFQIIAGMLIVPLSGQGNDFIVFFRKGQLKEVKWAGNPYEKFVKAGTEGYLEPRKSFKTWRETIVGRCRDWTEEEVETGAVLCLVYGKFIEVWRQKEVAQQNTELTRLLLANSAHEVRTPLNAIINYLEIALEGTLDQETRENLSKSHSASKSLIYVINDLLDLTKTEEGADLIKGESFDLQATLDEATNPYIGDAKRKGFEYIVTAHPGLPKNVLGDQRKVRQAITNVVANAIKYTSQGSVKVDMYSLSRKERKVEVEVAVADTGAGMATKELDSLFSDLEQVQSEPMSLVGDSTEDAKILKEGEKSKRTLGLGLAIVARTVRNMNGQLRLKSEEGKGSRFVIQFRFDLSDNEDQQTTADQIPEDVPVTTPQSEEFKNQEVTLVDRGQARPDSSAMARKNSAESVHSRKSMKSIDSGQSARSDVDKLIEAIQGPLTTGGSSSSSSTRKRPMIEQRHSFDGSQIQTRTDTIFDNAIHNLPELHRGATEPDPPGQESLSYSRTPVKAVKVPAPIGSPITPRVMRNLENAKHGNIIGEVEEKPSGSKEPENLGPDNMHVLVAEDDLVNSRIIKKRLEKLGHVVHLTGNGEECAGTYCDQSGQFDVVLMDMQMPIVDGLTSTKMIRSHEKTHPLSNLSLRARLNKRIPIIAVSASLVEKERQVYINAGFDAWILKPVSFPRLAELMKGIVDSPVRESALYTPGNWEGGGWFDMPQEDTKTQADTKPSEEKEDYRPTSPMREASEHVPPDLSETRDDDPFADARFAPKSKSMPHLRYPSDEGRSPGAESSSIFPGEEVASPDPLS